jgi:hypothetical protein
MGNLKERKGKFPGSSLLFGASPLMICCHLLARSLFIDAAATTDITSRYEDD